MSKHDDPSLEDENAEVGDLTGGTLADDEDTEGHRARRRPRPDDGPDEDTEAHKFRGN